MNFYLIFVLDFAQLEKIENLDCLCLIWKIRQRQEYLRVIQTISMSVHLIQQQAHSWQVLAVSF